jgi:hypothetical protein
MLHIAVMLYIMRGAGFGLCAAMLMSTYICIYTDVCVYIYIYIDDVMMYTLTMIIHT